MEDKVKDERITITFVSGLCLFKNFSFLSNRVFMASKLIILSVIILLLFDSCVSRSDYNTISSKCDSLQIEMEHKKEMNSDYSITIGLLRDSITILKDSIMRLSYPADQRYHHILNLIQVDSLDLAAIEIENLKSLFPLSKETENVHVQEELINTRRTEIKKEQDRIKAMGFKVIKDNLTIWTTDECRCSFGNFHYGRKFVFNYVEDINEYYYRTADKDHIYILADMSIYTKSNYASTPLVLACEIVDGKLSRIGHFVCEYKSYDTYGEYLGTYADTSHDFSKVSTVKYNIAAEISKEKIKHPIVILMFKNNKYDSVEGLTVSDVTEKCDVIKILNRNMLN